MKIGEGLQKVNSLKGQLNRLQVQRKRLFRLKADDEPEYSFRDISKLIEDKLGEISSLKDPSNPQI